MYGEVKPRVVLLTRSVGAAPASPEIASDMKTGVRTCDKEAATSLILLFWNDCCKQNKPFLALKARRHPRSGTVALKITKRDCAAAELQAFSAITISAKQTTIYFVGHLHICPFGKEIAGFHSVSSGSPESRERHLSRPLLLLDLRESIHGGQSPDLLPTNPKSQ